jgi:hypothetical protein
MNHQRSLRCLGAAPLAGSPTEAALAMRRPSRHVAKALSPPGPRDETFPVATGNRPACNDFKPRGPTRQIAFQHAVTYVAARLAGMDHAKAHIVVLALLLGCSWAVDGTARACVEFGRGL